VVAQRIRGLTGYHGAKISKYLLETRFSLKEKDTIKIKLDENRK
jgi:hypothetical protein